MRSSKPRSPATRKRGERRRPWRRALAGAVLLLAVALFFLPSPESLVERYYSQAIYPAVQSRVTLLTNLVEFPVGEALIGLGLAGAVVACTVRVGTAPRGRRIRALGSLALSGLVLGAALYILFLAMWGANYRRAPLAARLDFDRGRISVGAARAQTRALVERLNREVTEAHGEPWHEWAETARILQPSFDAALSSVGRPRGLVAAVPKHSFADRLLGAAGVAGVTHPFTHEVTLDRTLLPMEVPFTLAHEWAHLAGYADESEANFVALLACARSLAPGVRYSGWLALYPYLARQAESPPGEDDGKGEGRRSLSGLAPQVEADLMAIRQRESRRRIDGLSRLSWRAYDRFLKANRIESGTASYGAFVDLLLGTRFEGEWVPSIR